jgi:hypothetical protein
MKPIAAGLSALLLTLVACDESNKSSVAKQNDLGTGLNTVSRQYPKSTAETWAAAEAVLGVQFFKIESDKHDSLGGELQALRANGDKVEIHVRSLDEHHTDVSVRVAPGDRNMASILQDRIAEKLGVKEEAKAEPFGGNSEEGTYPNALSSCVKAADEASKRLGLSVINRDVNEDVAIVDAQEANRNPAQFQMKKTQSGSRVTFVAGHEKSDANKDLARRMKAEFENACTSKSN